MSKQIFTAEQLEAAKAAKSPEELVAMAKEQGVSITHEQAAKFLTPPIGELSDEELENVAGGGCGSNNPDDFFKCPNCGSADIASCNSPGGRRQVAANTYCRSCHHKWMRYI